jgi:molybdopterin/thiamine biosynthesis adenylyltransferase
MTGTTNRQSSQGSVAVIGAGGNIGSHLVTHLGRMPEITRVLLIDPDIYEPRNVRSQAITPGAIGRPKVTVQGRYLRRINRGLDIVTFPDAVQAVPLGLLRCDLILTCLDSRAARRYVNEAAWRCGVPWIDAGVEPGGLLARVDVFLPSPEQPCLECGWDDHDYALLEQSYPCDSGADQPPATNALSSLGALAASLQAIECHKLLTGNLDQAAVAHQVLIDAAHHRHFLTRRVRKPNCRFDHEVWNIATVEAKPQHITIGQALSWGGEHVDNGRALRVAGRPFVTKLTCRGCGHTTDTLRLQGRLRPSQPTCPTCGGERMPVGFALRDQLEARGLTARMLKRSLRSLGIRPHDICTVFSSNDVRRHYEIGNDRA